MSHFRFLEHQKLGIVLSNITLILSFTNRQLPVRVLVMCNNELFIAFKIVGP